MKKLRAFIAAFIFVTVGAFSLAPVYAEGALDVACADNQDSAVCEENNKPQNQNTDNLVKTIVNVLLYIVGIISFLMIIIAGFLYVVSQGDSSNVTRAKNTLLYAVVGLIVSFLAYAIVNWVLTKVF